MATESELAAELAQASGYFRSKYGHMVGHTDPNVLIRSGHELDDLLREMDRLAELLRTRPSPPPWAQ